MLPIARVEPLTTARSLRGPFDYRLPDGLGGVDVGSLLVVPFGHRRVLGVVVELARSTALQSGRVRIDPYDGSIRPGVRLTLSFLVSAMGPGYCVPLPNAMVDVWHCDALGDYSDVGPLVGHKFLRGFQMTDANGQAQPQPIRAKSVARRCGDQPVDPRPNASSPSAGERRARPRGPTGPRWPYSALE